jgi:hypothetical protein
MSNEEEASEESGVNLKSRFIGEIPSIKSKEISLEVDSDEFSAIEHATRYKNDNEAKIEYAKQKNEEFRIAQEDAFRLQMLSETGVMIKNPTLNSVVMPADPYNRSSYKVADSQPYEKPTKVIDLDESEKKPSIWSRIKDYFFKDEHNGRYSNK